MIALTIKESPSPNPPPQAGEGVRPNSLRVAVMIPELQISTPDKACAAMHSASPPAQLKSDISDFSHLKWPNSGKPEFGAGEG